MSVVGKKRPRCENAECDYKVTTLNNESLASPDQVSDARLLVSEYESGTMQLLGMGAHGKVLRIPEFMQFHQRNGPCVLKVGTRGSFERECTMLTLLGSVEGAVKLLLAFRTPSHDFLVLTEMGSRNLYQQLSALSDSTRVSPEDLLRRIEQILRILERVHKRKLVHADVKPENLVVGPDGDVRLIDFGNSVSLDNDMYAPDTWVTTLTFTPRENLPKYVKRMHGFWFLDRDKIPHCYTPKSDVWSTGVTLFWMMTRQPPFPWTRGRTTKENTASVLLNIAELNIPTQLLEEYVQAYSNFTQKLAIGLRDLLLNHMLVPLQKRASIDKLKEMITNLRENGTLKPSDKL